MQQALRPGPVGNTVSSAALLISPGREGRQPPSTGSQWRGQPRRKASVRTSLNFRCRLSSPLHTRARGPGSRARAGAGDDCIFAPQLPANLCLHVPYLLWDPGPSLCPFRGQESGLRHGWLVTEQSSKKWLFGRLLGTARACRARVPGAHGVRWEQPCVQGPAHWSSAAPSAGRSSSASLWIPWPFCSRVGCWADW